MRLFAEFRFDLSQLLRLFTGVGAVLLLILLAVVLVAGFSLYRVVLPDAPGAALNPRNLLGNPSVITVSGPGMKPRDGLFFPGQTSAPTILLAHGYESNSTELLTLVTALQDNRYNVFLVDFSGHGGSGGSTSLGYREARELLTALAVVAQRGDVDRERFGVWGTDLGGYAALAAAATDNRIRAVVADSVFDTPEDMLRMQVNRSAFGQIPLVQTLCRWGFKLLNFSFRADAPLSLRVPALTGAAKLFVQARDNPLLAESTLQLFLRSPEPRQQLLVATSNYARMSDQEKRSYESQVVSFFLHKLPPIAPPAP